VYKDNEQEIVSVALPDNMSEVADDREAATYSDTQPDVSDLIPEENFSEEKAVQSYAEEEKVVAYDFDIESAVEQEIMQQAEDSALQQLSSTDIVPEGEVSLEETEELEILEDVPVQEEQLEILEETVVDFDAQAHATVVDESMPALPIISPMDSFEKELFAALEQSTSQNSTAESETAETQSEEETGGQKISSSDYSESSDVSESVPEEETADEELEEALEEAAFFLDQKLFEEAIEIYEELLEEYPQNEKIPALLSQAWELFDVHTSSAPETNLSGGEIGDLADDLLKSEHCDEEGGNFEVLEEVHARNVPPELPETPRVIDGGPDEDDSVKLAEEIFAGLDDGPQELKLHSRNTSSSEVPVVDIDGIKTHYKLGVAYKEMGLLNEAVAEFNLAAEGGMFFDANAMLGACYLQKKMKLKAVACFKKLVSHPEMTRARLMELRYNIARTCEDSGELDLALRYYNAIKAVDPSFEDAAERAAVFEEQGIVAASQSDEVEEILEKAESLIPPDIESFGSSGSSDGNISYV